MAGSDQDTAREGRGASLVSDQDGLRVLAGGRGEFAQGENLVS